MSNSLNKMKAAAFSSFGTPDVLQTMEFDIPEASNGQVRVRVKAAGVQPFDLALRSGWAPPNMKVQLPQIPGNEFAGVVDQVGSGVTGFSVGSEVIGFKILSCYAEYVVVNADQITNKPKDMSWEEAGGLSGAGQTAYTMLRELLVGKGDTVLIHAAAGGVGTVAVQLARIWGASKVIGTASERNHDYLRELGAIPVTYGDGLAERVRSLAPEGIDAVLDAAGGDALRTSVELVKNRDRIGTIVGFDLAEELGVRAIYSQRSAARLAELASLHAQGQLHIHIRRTFSLHQAADAHREVESGHGRGKVVLTIH
ncbi:MAG: alcohol dehydrogenase [Paenibacillus sp.]|nr:alcohol dehydrogenase [Paenibacillus sp.]